MPVRKIPKSACTVTGLYPRGRGEPLAGYESRIERYVLILARFYPDTQKFDEQPIRIQFPGRHRLRSYTLDLLLTFSAPPRYATTGLCFLRGCGLTSLPCHCPRKNTVNPDGTLKPALLEVKYRDKLFKCWDEFKPKFVAARRHAKAEGMFFKLVTEKEVISQYLKNAAFLIPFRSQLVDEELQARIYNQVARSGKTTPAEVIAKFDKDSLERGQALFVFWRLLADHRLFADLSKPLNMEITVTAVGGTKPWQSA